MEAAFTSFGRHFMRKYKVDVGCYDCGTVIDIEADDLPSCLVRAGEVMDEKSKHCKSGEEPYLVQVSQEGKIVWDFLNGGLK